MIALKLIVYLLQLRPYKEKLLIDVQLRLLGTAVPIWKLQWNLSELIILRTKFNFLTELNKMVDRWITV